jgi:hypothetical protein
MRWIAIIALICLVGGASAQTTLPGEGYSRSQLSFLNGPTTGAFEPFVETYWNSYITNTQNSNRTVSNPATTMNIWMNTFPLNFNQPIQLKSTTFNAGALSAANYSPVEWNSMQLRRNTIQNFNFDQSWKYSQLLGLGSEQKSSISGVNNGIISATASGSSGQILSQGVQSLFSY